MRHRCVVPFIGKAPSYAGTLDAFMSTARAEGLVKGLWRGTTTSMARAALLSGSQLATYDRGKAYLKAHGGWEEGATLHLCCAAASGLVAQTVCQPAGG